MSFLRQYQRYLCAFIAFTFLGLTVNQSAVAAIVTTEQIVNAKEMDFKRDQIRNWLSRDEVKQQLIKRGVDPEQAKSRVASMTDTEVATVSTKIDQLPAGGDALGLLLLVFLVLIITDILGVTDIFTFIKKN